jgi:23S rRNA G2445 N2-methylase RlmL
MKKRESSDQYRCEAEVAAGLENIAAQELQQLYGQQIQLAKRQPDQGAVRFQFNGDLRALSRLATVQSVYLVQYFAVPRPRALLGDQHFRLFCEQIATVRNLVPADTYQSFYINAAGSDSSIMRRIKTAIAQQTGLVHAEEGGDLLIRIRRAGSGWETLVRLTPRPLATRSWRVCNFEGALNATVGQAMIRLAQPKRNDVFVNLACGSGSLLIERAAWGASQKLIGIDNSQFALDCAAANIQASGHQDQIDLCLADARKVPLPDNSADVLCADLPFGQLSGSHEDNLTLYPALFREATRIARPGARFVVITHAIQLMDKVLNRQSNWQAEQLIRVTLRGLHPGVYVLLNRQ